MILIDDIIVSDEIIEEHFVCDLDKCKGGCCVDGDAGAPLESEERKYLEEVYKAVEPYLTEDGKNEIKKNGYSVYDDEFGWVTPTIRNGMCAYGTIDKNGTVKCGIEQAFYDGKINLANGWKKPISCHLFPIRAKKTRAHQILNYEPRPGLCDPACKLGKSLKVPVYQFLKEPLIRKFGEEFFNSLSATAKHLKGTEE
ncbi:MAG: DUF3109 family protein [Chitinophagaceae bacterium]|nr:DUF3109 family protein [Chitinophagaceae bacterium]